MVGKWGDMETNLKASFEIVSHKELTTTCGQKKSPLMLDFLLLHEANVPIYLSNGNIAYNKTCHPSNGTKFTMSPREVVLGLDGKCS